jgi:hypothetical protein
MLVLSQNGKVRWTYSSGDMKSLGLWYVKWGTPVPSGTITAELVESGAEGIAEGKVDSDIWFKWPKRPALYEEAVKLGDRVLTWLVVDE